MSPELHRILSFTVDPEIDNPEALRHYAQEYKAYPNRWLFIRMNLKKLEKLAHEVFKTTTANDAKDAFDLDITHSTMLMLIDAQGRIRGYYDGLDEKRIAELMKAVKALS